MVLLFGDLFVLGTRTLRKGGVMIHWLGRLGRCVGASDHASFCLPCGVCFGCVLGHFIVPLQLHLHLHDYNEVVTSCNHSFSSPVRLSCVHRSCGEPRVRFTYNEDSNVIMMVTGSTSQMRGSMKF